MSNNWVYSKIGNLNKKNWNEADVKDDVLIKYVMKFGIKVGQKA